MFNWFTEMVESLASIPSWFTGMIESGRSSVIVLFGVLIILAIVFVVIVFNSKKLPWKAKQLAVGAICIALAFVLSYIRIWHMPQGGSITLASMLPIMVFAYIFGVRKGLVVGLAYGLLQMIQDPWVVHPIQAILDYGIAFVALALAGSFKKSILPGMIIAGIVRYAAHVISGFVFFAMYAPEGQHALIYSLGYNSFVFVDLLICIIVVIIPPVAKIVKSQREKSLG